ncbi:MAG: endonuclease III [Firmicutes bacterium]|nr:endonuclease III [Bacillota bacterium]
MNTLKNQDVERVLNILADTYPDAGCALDYGTPYQLLVAVTLSAQTTDKKVNQVTEGLFKLCPTAAEMSEFDNGELERILKPIGMYKNKAKNVINLSRILIEKYGGEVPDDQELLMELPGVGRKTANVVMSVAFGHQRIAVDTHVFRVANRIGLTDEKDVLNTELALMKAIPEDQWTVNHHRLIWHGRNLCSARKPDCEDCPLNGICLKKM